MSFFRFALTGLICLLLVACGEETAEQQLSKPAGQAVEQNKLVPSAAKAEVASYGKSTGGVTVTILPENPTSTGCLRAVIQGLTGPSSVVWSVNGSIVESGTSTQLCSDHYKREDVVSVSVGTVDRGGEASVKIDNSPPKVVRMSSTPEQIFAGMDITVIPVAEDADGDQVTFSYEWLINGESNPVHNEETLPGDVFKKGETIQVRIVPNDFYVDGPVYEGSTKPIGNAAPRIVSEPPSKFKTLDYRYQVEVSDTDDTQFTFRLDEGPEGMEIGPVSGLVRWALEGVEPGSYKITIIVTDPEGAEDDQGYNLILGTPQ